MSLEIKSKSKKAETPSSYFELGAIIFTVILHITFVFQVLYLILIALEEYNQNCK
jgi:hypothetical protein